MLLIGVFTAANDVIYNAQLINLFQSLLNLCSHVITTMHVPSLALQLLIQYLNNFYKY